MQTKRNGRWRVTCDGCGAFVEADTHAEAANRAVGWVWQCGGDRCPNCIMPQWPRGAPPAPAGQDETPGPWTPTEVARQNRLIEAEERRSLREEVERQRIEIGRLREALDPNDYHDAKSWAVEYAGMAAVAEEATRQVVELRQALAAAEQRERVLREAAQPFTLAGLVYPAEWPEETSLAPKVTLGDVLRLRAALEVAAGPHPPGEEETD